MVNFIPQKHQQLFVSKIPTVVYENATTRSDVNQFPSDHFSFPMTST